MMRLFAQRYSYVCAQNCFKKKRKNLQQSSWCLQNTNFHAANIERVLGVWWINKQQLVLKSVFWFDRSNSSLHGDSQRYTRSKIDSVVCETASILYQGYLLGIHVPSARSEWGLNWWRSPHAHKNREYPQRHTHVLYACERGVIFGPAKSENI